jgi:hypothetical protein
MPVQDEGFVSRFQRTSRFAVIAVVAYSNFVLHLATLEDDLDCADRLDTLHISLEGRDSSTLSCDDVSSGFVKITGILTGRKISEDKRMDTARSICVYVDGDRKLLQ